MKNLINNLRFIEGDIFISKAEWDYHKSQQDRRKKEWLDQYIPNECTPLKNMIVQIAKEELDGK